MAAYGEVNERDERLQSGRLHFLAMMLGDGLLASAARNLPPIPPPQLFYAKPRLSQLWRRLLG